MKRKIDLLPIPYGEIKEDAIVIVIDVVRATSTIATFFGEGGRELFVVEDVKEAFLLKDSLGDNVYIAGERGGIKVEGFDFDNSPLALKNHNVEGKTLILTTTNGTKTIKRYKETPYLFIGAFLNFSEVVDVVSQVVEKKDLDIFIVCAGKEGRFVIDDFLCGGMYINALLERDNFLITDAARMAHEFYNMKKGELSRYILESESGKNILRYGKLPDIEYLLHVDLYGVVPCLVNRDPLIIKNCNGEYLGDN